MSSFTMTTHQIRSCHVTLAANFDSFNFSPNSILNFWKSCQILGKLAQEQKSYMAKNPVLIGLSFLIIHKGPLKIYEEYGTGEI